MLSILDYHKKTTGYFQKQSAAWNFFSSFAHKEEQLKEFKTDLLKNTYRFTEEHDAALYQKVNTAKEKLQLIIPVIVYQAQNNEEMNASVAFVNNEAHIVFSGKMLQQLTEDELQAVIAHELSHVHLYTQMNGEVEVANRMINAIANHHGTTPAHYETARLFMLYTEIFCDRGAYTVTGNYGPIISSLVKISTGLQTVNPDSYIQQAEEIFSVDAQTKTSGISHPENFIRARAIWLWHTKGNEAEPIIKQMIEGYTNIEELDLFRQEEISLVTEQVVKLLLQPQWMQTAHTIALGKQYFGHLQLNEFPDRTTIAAQVENMHSNVQDYLAYVLYDFATNDKALEDVPLGYCFFLADELNIGKPFASAVKKEKKLTDKKVTALKKQTLAAFHSTETNIA